MDAKGAREFVRANHHAILATYRSSGSVQMTPVLAGVDDDGLVEVSTSERTAKVANLRRDPRASLCVMTDRFYGGSLQIDGPATIVSLPDALEPLVEYYRRISGEHPSWGEYREAMRNEQRCLIKVEIDRVSASVW